jgi:primosomal protein N' (replication factor Y)
MSIFRLAIPSPLRIAFDYLPPVDITSGELASVQPGCRIRVPFGRREVTGYLLEVLAETDLDMGKLRAAIKILDESPLISPLMMSLCQWAATYYHHPVGEVLAAAFPAYLRQGKQHKLVGAPGWCLSTRGKGLPHNALRRSPRQADALALLQQTTAIDTNTLAAEGISPAIMRSMQSKGLVEQCTLKTGHREGRSRPGLTLNAEQAAAVSAIAPTLGEFHCHLLEGITGSGKTEVYLQLIALCLERNLQALVLIPEIGLTPQTLDRFEDRFEAKIVRLHSGLAEGERYRAWEAARNGSAHIVIGTRSSIFAPLTRLGLIIVDEEHDGSYKQQDGFRYSARDIAVKRGQLERCPVLLGSATPSLESIHNVETGRYKHHPLQQRAGGAQIPTMEALDIRRQTLTGGLSAPLLEAVEETLQKGKQVLLFLNRRGYAPTLLCHDCGWLAQCRHCDARLTVHRHQGRLRCHHCSAAMALPKVCPDCHSGALLTAGIGTEQAAEILRRRYPDFPLHQVDSDSMRGKDAMKKLVAQMNRGEACILLGTQMLTKGHHFPSVNLVAVIDADAALFSADFRGEERMAQLLTQVAGRAGRAGEPGTVLLQTHYPDHPVLRAIMTLPYAIHARAILAQRLEMGMPPAAFLVLIRADSVDPQGGEQFLGTLRDQIQSQLPREVTLVGPLPSPMQRRAGRFRSQLLLKASKRATAQAAARLAVDAAGKLPSRALNWSIDIDPQDGF